MVDLELPESVNGIYTILHGQNTIILNDTLDKNMRKSVCAHELGHVILHGSINCLDIVRNTNFVVSKFETEADTFACFLLIDEESLSEMESSDSCTVEDVAKHFQVPFRYAQLYFDVI